MAFTRAANANKLEAAVLTHAQEFIEQVTASRRLFTHCTPKALIAK